MLCIYLHTLYGGGWIWISLVWWLNMDDMGLVGYLIMYILMVEKGQQIISHTYTEYAFSLRRVSMLA